MTAMRTELQLLDGLRAGEPVSVPVSATPEAQGIKINFKYYQRVEGSFFGVLHAQGRDAVEFYTDKKVVIERWPKEWSRKF